MKLQIYLFSIFFILLIPIEVSMAGLMNTDKIIYSNGVIDYTLPFKLRGVMISGYDFWKSSKINSSDFDKIKSWGMNHVRLTLHWEFVEHYKNQSGVYTEGFLEQVDKYVEWAKNSGLYVILGMSKGNDANDIWIKWRDFFHDPDTRERFYNVWSMIAARYSKYDNVIGFNPCHVPGHKYSPDNETEQDVAQDIWHNIMVPEIVNRIRQVNKKVIIVYEPVIPFERHFKDLTPIADSNVLYSFNFYEPDSVTHRLQPYNGDKESLQNSEWWQNCINFGKKYNVPLYCGEWAIRIRMDNGTLYEPPSADHQLWVKHVLELLEENGVHWAYYAYGYDSTDFDLLNSDGSERTVVSILKNYSR